MDNANGQRYRCGQAAGLGRRAAAQDTNPCNDLFAQCAEQVEGRRRAVARAPDYYNCLAEQGGACTAYFQTCKFGCGGNFGTSGRACQGGCRAHEYCALAVNPGNRLVCRCISL